MHPAEVRGRAHGQSAAGGQRLEGRLAFRLLALEGGRFVGGGERLLDCAEGDVQRLGHGVRLIDDIDVDADGGASSSDSTLSFDTGNGIVNVVTTASDA